MCWGPGVKTSLLLNHQDLIPRLTKVTSLLDLSTELQLAYSEATANRANNHLVILVYVGGGDMLRQGEFYFSSEKLFLVNFQHKCLWFIQQVRENNLQ